MYKIRNKKKKARTITNLDFVRFVVVSILFFSQNSNFVAPVILKFLFFEIFKQEQFYIYIYIYKYD